jgi:Zn-finger nucleic acid-binding protein
MSGYREREYPITLTLDAELWQRLGSVMEMTGGQSDREAISLEALRRGLRAVESEANTVAARAVTRCPRCGHQPLEPRDVGSTRLQACLGCGGVWLDNDSAAALIESLDPEVRELASRATLNARVPVATDAALTCPVCEGAMELRRFTTAKVRLDICQKHGTWFDRFELARLVDVMTECRERRRELERVAGAVESEVSAIYARVRR